jgi:hypothetical protein
MAIKPNDCIIRIEDLVIGIREGIDPWTGRDVVVTQYEQYWENFCEHVNKLSKKVDTKNWKDWRVTPENMIYEQELARFGAVHKETKKFADRYVKFKTHADLTMFVLRWS